MECLDSFKLAFTLLKLFCQKSFDQLYLPDKTTFSCKRIYSAYEYSLKDLKANYYGED